MSMITRIFVSVSLGVALLLASVADAKSPSRQQVIAQMKPYTGNRIRGVNTSTLFGKVMCGYQGWFMAEGDGGNRGWVHYSARGQFKPGQCSIDLWPDMSELGSDEKYPTSFKHKNGSVASVFSSQNRKTVVRHFKWMRDHGIDGVFLQRFGSTIKSTRGLAARTTVTANVQAGANLHGRTWAMMYDLSGLRAGDIEKYVIEDWKLLIDKMRITRDKAYLRHRGKPVVAVWGIGFNDKRKYTLDECQKLIEFLKNDPKYGGNTVVLGVPTWWRTLRRDAVSDKKLHDVIRRADIVSPWTIGRYQTPRQAQKHIAEVGSEDLQWCKAAGKEYLPVIFPGFSWHNMHKARGEDSPLGKIPRLGGKFLWSQAIANSKIGASMTYLAMFDEIDEGTAIFKCTNNPPIGASKFLTYKDLPTDHYLWLTGRIGRLVAGKIPATEDIPKRKPAKTLHK
ncbi:MAG: xylosidase/arabinosidase [Phycisphaerales bacterium]|jgi:hypothetical protein|nr:xylosidase/arabinosidase [Phycisphaerales bacterium]